MTRSIPSNPRDGDGLLATIDGPESLKTLSLPQLEQLADGSPQAQTVGIIRGSVHIQA